MYCNSWKSLSRLLLSAGVAWVLLGFGAVAQVPPPNAPPAQNAPQQLLSPDQLDDLVAPIALYPDQLLSQVLVACTYPLEVVEAQQWLQAHSQIDSLYESLQKNECGPS